MISIIIVILIMIIMSHFENHDADDGHVYEWYREWILRNENVLGKDKVHFVLLNTTSTHSGVDQKTSALLLITKVGFIRKCGNTEWTTE